MYGEVKLRRRCFDTLGDVPAAVKGRLDLRPEEARPPGRPAVSSRARFNLDNLADTFLDMSKWKKGVAWVNGHNLGRYWSIGPQQRPIALRRG